MSDTLERWCVFAPDHPAAPAHFPGQPIVPGVWLLDQVFRCLEEAGYSVTALRAARFANMALPGQQLRIEIKLSPGEGQFAMYHEDSKLLRGTVEVSR